MKKKLETRKAWTVTGTGKRSYYSPYGTNIALSGEELWAQQYPVFYSEREAWLFASTHDKELTNLRVVPCLITFRFSTA